jgi:xanthine dehydrogenase YagR molybdenum-binding subunit
MTMAKEDALRTEVFPYGIAGVGLGKVERQVPVDEPPALPPNADLNVIGKSVPRQDGRAKVTGAIRFTADISLPGMLYGRILRSPMPHAQPRSLDISAAARHPSVRAVLPIGSPDDPQSATFRYIGAPVAAVAAISMAAAEEALRLIQVDYHSLPFVVEMDRARAQAAPHVYESAEAAPGGHPSGWPAAANLPLNGNVRGPAISRRGNVTRGFAEADVILEAEYRTQVQTHCCLEPHGIVADWRADGLTVHISTQYTTGVRHELAEEFGLPLNRVRVIVDAMGGGFGSKSTLGNYGRFAVELSRRAQAPVRLVLDREEEQMDAGNRPGTWQRLRMGAKRDGALTAISLLATARQVSPSAPASASTPRRFMPVRISRARSTTCSSMPGRAARCAHRATHPVPSGSSKRWTNWLNGLPSTRSSCASASILARCGVKSGASGPSGSAGSAGEPPALIRVP